VAKTLMFDQVTVKLYELSSELIYTQTR
jgi:hypothetical protein